MPHFESAAKDAWVATAFLNESYRGRRSLGGEGIFHPFGGHSWNKPKIQNALTSDSASLWFYCDQIWGPSSYLQTAAEAEEV